MAYVREGFLANGLYKALGAWELEWVNTTQPVTRSPGGDAEALATKLFDHYRKMIAAADKEAPSPPSWC